MAAMSIESTAGRLKEIIDRNGPSYMTDEPYKVYLERIDSGAADRKTTAAITNHSEIGYNIELLTGRRHLLNSSSTRVIFIIKDHARLEYGIDSMIYDLKANDIFVIGSYEPYLLTMRMNALAISLNITQDLIRSIDPDYSNRGLACRSFLSAENEQGAFDELRRKLSVCFQVENKGVRIDTGTIRENITEIVHYIYTQYDNGAIFPSDRKREILHSAMDYILTNYKEPLSLDIIAQNTYLNKSYISHCFTECLGITVYEYLTAVRLFQAKALLYGDKSITDIASECGFPNINSIAQTFRKHLGITPREYRRQLASEYSDKSVSDQRSDSYAYAMSILEKYAGKWSDMPDETLEHQILIDLNSKAENISQNWKKILNAGFAEKLLEGEIQREIREIQSSIGFEYIRCKGILDDDMYLYTEDYYGVTTINFTYLDDIIDFILSVDAKPMLELGSMPSCLAARKTKGSMRPVYLSPPGSDQEWENLIFRIMEHLRDRYGAAAVGSWLFSPWFTIDNIGALTEDEYFQTYQISSQVIRKVSPDSRICGPGCAYHRKYLPLFLKRCREMHCLPDIITIRSSSSVSLEEEDEEIQKLIHNEQYSRIISEEQNLLAINLADVRTLLNREGLSDLPVYVEEWTGSSWPGERSNDTCYRSAYIFKNALENYDSAQALAYYALNDRLDELIPSKDLFFGGFGLYTSNGLPKSALLAFLLLSRMQSRMLAHGDGYFVTADENDVAVFLYNYCHYDTMYRLSHTEDLPDGDRYKVFVKGNTNLYHLNFSNLREGKYKIRKYSIRPHHAGAFDIWVEAGMPDPIDHEEYQIIRHASMPSYKTETITVSQEDQPEITVELVPHEVVVVQLQTITHQIQI